MAYSPQEKDKIFNAILDRIENGTSTRKAVIDEKISSKTFWGWIDADEEKGKQYTRACEARAEFMADEILQIADSNEADLYKDDDGNIKIDGNTVQRARTQIDARKWLMSKMFPKKYGDKLDHTTNGKDLQSIPPVINLTLIPPKDE